jgi:ketosteroid isomerase-like protein
MSLFDDNTEWVQPGDSAISGTYHGKRELGELVSRLAEKSTTVTPRRYFADGDTVVMLGETAADNETSEAAQVFTLREGKIVRSQVYGDTALVERIYGKKEVATA